MDRPFGSQEAYLDVVRHNLEGLGCPSDVTIALVNKYADDAEAMRNAGMPAVDLVKRLFLEWKAQL